MTGRFGKGQFAVELVPRRNEMMIEPVLESSQAELWLRLYKIGMIPFLLLIQGVK